MLASRRRISGFYEAQGLLSPKRNFENSNREYGDEEAQTLQRIKLMRKPGIPIEDIRIMLTGSHTVAVGMENAREKGRQIGCPQVSKEDIPASFLRHYPAHKNGQLNISELARVCDISRTTAYKYKSLLEV